jgi:hypothetical protein
MQKTVFPKVFLCRLLLNFLFPVPKVVLSPFYTETSLVYAEACPSRARLTFIQWEGRKPTINVQAWYMSDL